MDSFLFWLGFFLVLAGLLWWLNKNGYLTIVAQLLNYPVHGNRSTPVQVIEKPIAGYEPDAAPTMDRVRNLDLGDIVEMTVWSGDLINAAVVAVITHHELKQFGNKEWRPTGDTFQLFKLRSGEWLWVHGANLALFTQTLQLDDIQLTMFKNKAQEYGKQQKAFESGERSELPDVTFELQEVTLFVQDIGKSDLQVEGEVDAKSGDARFIRAENEDGRIAWVEERKGGDVLMFGRRVTLENFQNIY